MSKFGVARGKSIPMAVDLKLHRFDRNESDVHEPFRSLVVHRERDSTGHPQRGQSGGNVLCSAKGQLHWQAALHIVMYIKIYKHLRHYVPERSKMWS